MHPLQRHGSPRMIMRSRLSSTLQHSSQRKISAPAALCCLLFWISSVQAQTEAPEVAQLAALRTEARAYEHGEGVPRDARRAIELYCQAAKLGDAEAQFSL